MKLKREWMLEEIGRAVSDVLETMGVPLGNPELDIEHTPQRVARMYVDELFAGYFDHKLDDLRARFTVFSKATQHELVVINNIPFHSTCAHHMMPWFGTAAFGYLPKEKVIGLSKLPRVLDHFAARLQTQEQLTSDVADFVWKEAEPHALIVVLRAQHLCCSARGIKKPGVEMRSSAIRPQEDFPAHLREEFYRLIG
jgi:GTP cyclohydrolase I